MVWKLASLLLITVPRRAFVPANHYPHLYTHHLFSIATRVAATATTATTTTKLATAATPTSTAAAGGGNPRPPRHRPLIRRPDAASLPRSFRHWRSPSDTAAAASSCRMTATAGVVAGADPDGPGGDPVVTSTLGEFLASVRRDVVVLAGRAGGPPPADGKTEGRRLLPHLALGNPAGDADSIVSAIGLAYVDSLLASSSSSDGGGPNRGGASSAAVDVPPACAGPATIPIVSIPMDDLKFQRPETTFLLQACAGLTGDLDEYLIAVDDRGGLLPDRATLTLVDHNSFHGIGGSSGNAKRDGWVVTEIVDHHLDDKAHLDTCPPGPMRNIAFDETSKTATVASTCTLVVERFYDGAGSGGATMPPSLAILLLGVILIDSVNMNPAAGKGTPRDGAAIQALLDRTDWTQLSSSASSQPSPPREIMDAQGHRPDPTKLFECLQAQKFSPDFWNGLTTLQALRMDYKSFPIAASSHDDVTDIDTDDTSGPALGISTILLDMDTFWESRDDIERTMYNELKEQNLRVLGLMFTSIEGADEDGVDPANGNLRRQLGLASTNKKVLDQMVEYLLNDETAITALQLDRDGMIESKVMTDVDGEKKSMIHIVRMNQENVTSSRKQIAPILMGFWMQH